MKIWDISFWNNIWKERLYFYGQFEHKIDKTFLGFSQSQINKTYEKKSSLEIEFYENGISTDNKITKVFLVYQFISQLNSSFLIAGFLPWTASTKDTNSLEFRLPFFHIFSPRISISPSLFFLSAFYLFSVNQPLGKESKSFRRNEYMRQYWHIYI